MVKRIATIILLACLSVNSTRAQKHTPLPHGMVFGAKPSTVGTMPAAKVEAFMDKQTRTNVVLIGRVLKVNRTKGGWFDMDAGSGKIITAHFKNANVVIPADIKGREVIAEGVAQKEFIADDLQHIAGDTIHTKKQHLVKTDPTRKLTFEVKGLMVNR